MKLTDLPTTYEDRIVAWLLDDARRHDGANFRIFQDELAAAAARGEVSDDDAAKWIRAHTHAVEALVREAHALTRYARLARDRA